MDSVKSVSYGIVCGIKDSICGIAVLFQLYHAQEIQQQQSDAAPATPTTVLAMRRAHHNPRSVKVNKKTEDEPRIVNRILQCCALNGGVFWVSIFVFHSLLLPSLSKLTLLIFGSSPGFWSWMQPLLSCVFSALWVLPLFLLSKVVNSLWFQDIADSVYRFSRGRPHLLPSVSKLVADTLFSVLIQALFLIQGTLVSLLPIAAVGELMSLLHMCLLYSLYAFEYKWFNMGWELHKRLSFIENNWPYFFGFGLPLATLTAVPSSYVVSGCVFSILFPLFIISGNEAEPLAGNYDFPLKLFSPVVCVSNTLFKTIRAKSFENKPLNVKTVSQSRSGKKSF